jgi:hypothetical protein
VLLLLVACGTGGTPGPEPDGPRVAAEPSRLPTWRGRHVGPVTGVAVRGGGLVSCSQAGIAWAADAPVVPAAFRPFALAVLGDAGELLVGGGRPGASGEVALAAREAVHAGVRLSDDLIYAVAVAPAGERAAAGGADGRVHLLSLPRLQPLEVFAHHTAPCRAVAFTGNSLVSAGLDGVVVVRDLAAGSVQRLLDHTAGIECLAVAADGSRIASGAQDGKVRVHQREGRLRRTFGRLGAAVRALAWLDERTLLAGLADGRLLALADEGDGRRVEVAHHDGPIHALARYGSAVALGVDGGVVLAPLPPAAGAR